MGLEVCTGLGDESLSQKFPGVCQFRIPLYELVGRQEIHPPVMFVTKPVGVPIASNDQTPNIRMVSRQRVLEQSTAARGYGAKTDASPITRCPVQPQKDKSLRKPYN